MDGRSMVQIWFLPAMMDRWISVDCVWFKVDLK